MFYHCAENQWYLRAEEEKLVNSRKKPGRSAESFQLSLSTLTKVALWAEGCSGWKSLKYRKQLISPSCLVEPGRIRADSAVVFSIQVCIVCSGFVLLQKTALYSIMGTCRGTWPLTLPAHPSMQLSSPCTVDGLPVDRAELSGISHLFCFFAACDETNAMFKRPLTTHGLLKTIQIGCGICVKVVWSVQSWSLTKPGLYWS